MTSGIWDGIEKKVRPGFYYRILEAVQGIVSGERGVVAIPLFEYTGEAKEGQFYEISGQKEAETAFGVTGAEPVVRVLQGGTKRALVYAAPKAIVPESGVPDYAGIRDLYEARPFNVFVYPTEVGPDEQDDLVAWTARNRNEGKHFFAVIGGTAEEDQDITVGNARSKRCMDEYVINCVNGVITGAGDELHSGVFASYIAGLVGGTAINKGITNQSLPFSDVNRRFKNSEITEALKAGSLVFVNDGSRVYVEQGITTSKSESKRGKIRTQSARQAILTDIAATVVPIYIGKVDNEEAGQTTVVNAIQLFLEQLEKQKVLRNPATMLDPDFVSEDDSMYIAVAYQEVDSAEFIYLTIRV